MKNNIKKYSIVALIGINIFAAGAVLGGFEGYDYAKSQAHGTEQAVQSALKTITVASAPKN